MQELGVLINNGLNEGLLRCSVSTVKAAEAFAVLSRALNRAYYFKEYTESYPNRRVVYLAEHHKKARVRKKNSHRIANDFKKLEKF